MLNAAGQAAAVAECNCNGEVPEAGCEARLWQLVHSLQEAAAIAAAEEQRHVLPDAKRSLIPQRTVNLSADAHRKPENLPQHAAPALQHSP